jgi:hypothetical protein
MIVPLVFAAVSSATSGLPLFNTAYGPITSLTGSGLTLQADGEIPTSCTTTPGSPTATGFKVGEQVTIACKRGVLASITKGRGEPRLGPVIPITGLAESLKGALPARGPRPTQEQCAAAWNRNAPLASRQAIGALIPLAIQVVVGSGDVLTSPPPSSHVVASGPICDISFVLPGARTARVTSVWKHGTARDWQGSIDGGYPHLVITLPGFSVSAIGKLSKAA